MLGLKLNHVSKRGPCYVYIGPIFDKYIMGVGLRIWYNGDNSLFFVNIYYKYTHDGSLCITKYVF